MEEDILNYLPMSSFVGQKHPVHRKIKNRKEEFEKLPLKIQKSWSV